jgi:glycosyltransferase involved in cell wall biosynthesis
MHYQVNFTYILYALFFGGILTQLIYLLFIFTRLIRHRDFESNYEGQTFPPVSIIIAAMNELKNLKELLPLLEKQDYPDFEIVVADDRSSDGTYDYLLNNEESFRKVTFSRIESTPSHFTPKKYAMTVAIKKSKNDIILTTDADCRPVDNQWIKQMTTQLTADRSVVLGVSPYYYYKGLLNAFIRYETLQTAVQYLSFTLAKIPFMGVGRNLMFRKELFWKTNGYARHADLLSGDDDLFINEATNSTNVAISVEKETQVYSEPKRTFSDWVIQKKRHLSVGKRYKVKDKATIGLLWVSLLMSWFLFIPALFITPSFEVNLPVWLIVPAEFLAKANVQHWEPFTNWMRLVTCVFVGWLLLRWLILGLCNKRLSVFVKPWKILWYDLLYTLYIFIFGIITIFSNPKKLKWK